MNRLHPVHNPPACERCGTRLPMADVTRFGDREPQYIVARSCDCPGPRCVCCHKRLADGRCPTLGCPIYDCLVPLPEVW